MDELAKMMGFEDEQELHRMVAAADLSTPPKLKAFQLWKEFDGSKVGLSKLLPQPKEKAAEKEPGGLFPYEVSQHYMNKEVPPCPGCEYEKRMKP